MKYKISLMFILFCKLLFSQVFVESIHNSREISITISCDTDSTIVFTGAFESYKKLCCGNVVHIPLNEKDRIRKQDALIELNLCLEEEQVFNGIILKKGELFKIRLINEKGLKISKKKDLKIYLTVDGKRVEVLSKRFRRFCHKNTENCRGYKMWET